MTLRWSAAALGLLLLWAAIPATGSFHETIGVVPDRAFFLVFQGTSINGMEAPNTPLLEAYLGEKVQFTILAPSETHTFHLHGHPWLVNGTIVDVFAVDPTTPHAFDITAGGPDHQSGDWMYHCHIDQHMMAGMWGIFRVYPFMNKIQQVQNTVNVELERLGIPLDGASLAITVDGVPVPAHVEPQGDGRYQIHAALPDHGALVVTATHPAYGVSVARATIGGGSVALPTLGISGAGPHAHS